MTGLGHMPALELGEHTPHRKRMRGNALRTVEIMNCPPEVFVKFFLGKKTPTY